MVTIFTPTYNRAQLLPRLYESLQRQTEKAFEWLLVDDGSSDNTEAVVAPWLTQADFTVHYIKKQNGGKHTAFNCGVQAAQGDLFFCVDSDDFLPDTAVADLLAFWQTVQNKALAGVIAMKTDQNGKLLSAKFPNVQESTMYAFAARHGCAGEKALVYRTAVLKEFPFPEIAGERFMSEAVVYDAIDQAYSMAVLPKVLTVCEYQADGLSGNFVRNMLQNPTGFQIYYSRRIHMAIGWKERIGYILRYNAFYIFSRNKAYAYRGKYKALVTLTKPLGYLLTLYYKTKTR